VFLDGFILQLRDYGIPVSLTDSLDFYRGMERGLAPDLDSLFLFARLCFVRRVEHMDSYERAFAFHFYGIDLPRVAEGDPELLNTPQFRQWLKEAIRKGELPPQALWTFPAGELMKRFWETVKKQMEEHHGGSRWIGTGGNSPFGHSGNSQGGVRVHGEGGKLSASNVLSGANLAQALTSLKKLSPAGARDQLDLDATIHESARNGGEIELVFRRDLLDRIEVVLLIDNGGSSMLPHVDLTRLLFAKVRDRIKRCTTYFFHNTVYGAVYKDAQRRRPLATPELLKRSPDTRLLIVGDASMAPEELLYASGSLYFDDGDAESSLRWLERLRDRFRHTVWLNPIPKELWPQVYGRATIQRIGEVFPMEDLTLGGIKRAVTWLTRG